MHYIAYMRLCLYSYVDMCLYNCIAMQPCVSVGVGDYIRDRADRQVIDAAYQSLAID
jgi:hypothetical protein